MTINPIESPYGRLDIDTQKKTVENTLQENPDKEKAASTAISMGDVVSISDEGKTMSKAQVHYASKKMLGKEDEEEETDSTEAMTRMEEIQKEMLEVQQELQKVLAEEGSMEEKDAKVKELQTKLQMLQTELTELMDSSGGSA